MQTGIETCESPSYQQAGVEAKSSRSGVLIMKESSSRAEAQLIRHTPPHFAVRKLGADDARKTLSNL